MSALSLWLCGGESRAAPRIPPDDTVVLERLPTRATDPAARELKQLRDRVAADPREPTAAVRLARRYFRMAMAEGDPRYVGYGESTLRPWWNAPASDVPVPVLVARALLKQYKHDFAAALADLDVAARATPSDEEIWSWRAALHLVQGDYAAAYADCDAYARSASQNGAAQCRAWVDGTTGKAAAAYAAMRRAYETDRESPAGERVWTLTRLAELAERTGDDARAEAHYRAAFALGVADQYLLAAYADFLLDRDRPREVITLLADWTRSDVLLLRLALAERAAGDQAAGGHTATLKARFEAAAARGDRLHLLEESRFNLALARDAPAALALARENWRKQREPRDARMLLEAALAANDGEAAAPVLEWLRTSGHEDRRIRAIAARIEAEKR